MNPDRQFLKFRTETDHPFTRSPLLLKLSAILNHPPDFSVPIFIRFTGHYFSFSSRHFLPWHTFLSPLKSSVDPCPVPFFLLHRVPSPLAIAWHKRHPRIRAFVALLKVLHADRVSLCFTLKLSDNKRETGAKERRREREGERRRERMREIDEEDVEEWTAERKGYVKGGRATGRQYHLHRHFLSSRLF